MLVSHTGLILLLLFGSIGLTAFAAVKLLRFIGNKTGNRDLINNGVVLAEDGIYVQRFFFGKRKVFFNDIEEVEFVPFPQSLLAKIRYAPSVYSRPGAGLFEGTVAIKFKDTCFARYQLYHPTKPSEFAEKLKLKVQQSRLAQNQ